jgi:hypothetical protein
MKLSFVFLSFLFCININAQINFQEHIIIDESISANDPNAILSADIDGDGDSDILSSSYADRKIAWYENLDGNGTYGTQRIIATTSTYSRISSIHLADVDNDGDLDLLWSSDNGDFVGWFKNLDGLGNFGDYSNIGSQLNGASSVFSKDIDGDGDLDVLSTSSIDDEINWFENLDGLGDFGLKNTISDASNGAKSVLSKDIDGDGYMDVIIMRNNAFEWFKNLNGLGDFGPKNAFSVNSVESIHIDDFDNDGDMDIVTASDSNNTIKWFENTDGLGTYDLQHIISTSAINAKSVFSIDIDNDGDVDIISASREDDKIAWYENLDSMGNFSTEKIVSTNAKGARLIYADDLDGDGDNDLISGSMYDDKIVWYKNTNGLGQFEEQNKLTQSAFKPESIFAADLDGDGDQDVLSSSWADDKISWYENTNGLGDFSKQKIISTDTNYPVYVVSSDIDGDGDMDVLSASRQDNKIAWYENLDGQGNFGDQQIISSTESNANYIYTVDLDEDGDMDVLTSSYDGIAWYINTNGLGQFSSRQVISASSFQNYSPVAADLDGDGDLDIASTARYSGGNNELAWYENTDGQQTYIRHGITTNIDAANSTFVTDIDQDGDIDIIAAAYNKIALYENNTGLGNFSSEQLLTVDYLHGANSINYYDMDLDGIEDLIYGLSSDDKIVWKKRNASGYFGATQEIATNAVDVKSVFVTDIDGDTDMDVVFSSIGDNKISWYENSTITLNITDSKLENFTIYPNPADNILNIESKTNILQTKIYNSLGQLVLTKTNDKRIDISNLNNGIYFIKIIDTMKNTEIKKIIKK